MKQNFALRTIAVSLGTVFGLGVLAGCGDGGSSIPIYNDNLVIMTEELNELYNPFYSTAGTDMDVVGQTQISMLSTDADGNLSYGNDEPCLVLDYKTERQGENTVYYFVLKNGLKFSDGTPITMNDVLFNMYVYLDPAYTGSTTMYSTDIVGLADYRAQEYVQEGEEDNSVTELANTRAKNRTDELVTVFDDVCDEKDAQNLPRTASEDEMKAAIDAHTCTEAYMQAIGETDPAKAREQLKQDYTDSLAKFRQELENDFKSAKSSYTEAPYDTVPVYYLSDANLIRNGFDDIISFFYYEGNYSGMTDDCYGRTETGNVDKTQVQKVILNVDTSKYSTMDAAVEKVYRDTVPAQYDQILNYWATGTQMRTEFAAKAKEVYLHGQLTDGTLQIKNISGIVSLGHTEQDLSITIGSNTYQIAHTHKTDGTPENAGEYDVLRITIKGVDPKAQWNFGFTVAPYHYYSDPDQLSDITKKKLSEGDALTKELWGKVTEVNIKENKFGVAWADFDFQSGIIQGTNKWGESKNKIPFGGGPYIATDRSDSDTPAASGFVSGDVVYYKANPNFSLDGINNATPKIEHMHYQVTSAANALSSLESGQVHFVSPQFTGSNIRRINELADQGVGSLNSWQLGYGYIGINAGEIKDINLRKAIMASFDRSLAIEYYEPGTAVTIEYPMSAVNWAYPRSGGAKYDGNNPTANMDLNNQHDYAQFEIKRDGNGRRDEAATDAAARQEIISYMNQAGNFSAKDLEFNFTIAGANMYDHPAYLVFKKAAELLNSCEVNGKRWNVTLQPDANALTKLATGSLTVWAAAWGSTIDPDMYQVYHKNSTATSVLAWGYDDILANPSVYPKENQILTKLSKVIDDARENDDQAYRTGKYKEALGYVLDLAIEFPLYQRKVLYAYNKNVIDENSMPKDANGNIKINPYTSPLSRIWELEIIK